MITIKHIILFVAIAVLASCSSQPSEVKDEHKENDHNEVVEFTQAQFDNAKIQIGKVEMKTLSSTLAVTGMIDVPPQNLISISAPLGGYIVNTDLIDGMKIRKGQKLVTLEHQDYIKLQQDYFDKRSQLEYLEKEYARQQKLRNENVNSDKVFQQSTSDYKSMKAQVNGLKEMLSYIGINAENLKEDKISRRITLFSPVNGYISKMNINVGKYCSPTDILFEIVNTEHLHVELTVFEKDLQKIKIDQKVIVQLPGSENERIDAKVYIIGRTISSDRTVKVHAHFEKESNHLAPGMYVNGKIELDENKVQAVPDAAILRFQGKFFVVLSKGTGIENGKKMYNFELKEVEVGVSEFGFTEIRSLNNDLKDDQIVINGAYSILAKLKNSEEEGGHGH